jgi:hypothetical protein
MILVVVFMLNSFHTRNAKRNKTVGYWISNYAIIFNLKIFEIYFSKQILKTVFM